MTQVEKKWHHYATQYLSGHRNFNHKLYGFRLKPNPWCESCGGVEETAWHVLSECPEYDRERADLVEVWSGIDLGHRRKICVTSDKIETFC